MNSRIRILAVFIAAVIVRSQSTISEACSADERPNVIVILSDDQGWGDLSLNGNKNLETPNIDQIALKGAQFQHFYVCPVCSPTRAEFLTGRYHPRSGVYSTSAGGERMNLDQKTIADAFRNDGYKTGAFGKWHNGMQYPYHPNGRGFDEFYGFCSGHWGNYFSPMLERNGQLVKGSGFCVDDFTDQLLKFVEANKEQPFFAYLPLNTPHSPMQVPDRFWKRFEDKKLEMRNRSPEKENEQHTRAALAMCENIDWNVGRILEKLDELRITEQTIVVYFCDNGPNGWRWNGGLKGRKGSTDEGGVRSPLLIRFPREINAGQVVQQIGGAVDLFPTLADFCQIQMQSELFDGLSLRPVLTNKAVDAATKKKQLELRERLIVSHWNRRVSVRNQQFRLDHQGKLFEIETDPGQSQDVGRKFPEVAKKLKEAADNYRTELLTDLWNDQRSFPLGHPEYRYTQIPARDAKVKGGLKRSNRFPNCSFFTNWKTTDDRLLWDVEVLQSGTYEVELYYTCPAEDIGSLVQLRFGDAKLKAQITKAHDPPLIGADEDRVKRVESYVKDFQSMSLGRIKLSKGQGKLELSAVEIPGAQVMDFRLLMFKRVQ